MFANLGKKYRWSKFWREIVAKNFCLIVARICAFPSTQLHTNSLKFESEISLKNGVQNGVRFEKMPLRYSEKHFQWRWADSNRRPNTVPGGFLHVYPAFGFRPGNAGRRADPGLSFGAWRSLKESLRASGLNDTPCSGHNRPKACGILVSAAALAAWLRWSTWLITQRVQRCC